MTIDDWRARYDGLNAETDKLRVLLAASNANCAFCGLPAAEMAKCASGFPGCSRADDMLLCEHPTRQDLLEENERLRKALGEIAAVTSQLGPDRASSQYMAEQAYGIASAFLANAEPGGGMTNQDHVLQILDDVLLLLAGQYYPTPERTYKLDGGWSLALADLKRCFGDLRADLALVKFDLDAERAGVARLRAEVERLQEDADRARWCEENEAYVVWLSDVGMWVVSWNHDALGADQFTGLDRNAAIDAARGKA